MQHFTPHATRHFIVLLVASASSIAAAHECRSPPHPDDRAAWADIYLRWSLGDRVLPSDEHGNAVLGRTVLLPIPATPGDGTPGSITVAMYTQQPFSLQLWGLIGNAYTDGTPPDPLEPISIFETLNITLRLDGEALITSDNVLDFFAQLVLDPPLSLDDPLLASIIWYQTLSIVHPPLPAGTHVLQLDAVNTQPAFGQFFEYHNTWTLDVE